MWPSSCTTTPPSTPRPPPTSSFTLSTSASASRYPLYFYIFSTFYVISKFFKFWFHFWTVFKSYNSTKAISFRRKCLSHSPTAPFDSFLQRGFNLNLSSFRELLMKRFISKCWIRPISASLAPRRSSRASTPTSSSAGRSQSSPTPIPWPPSPSLFRCLLAKTLKFL